jgi:predicted Rossmann fold nucleotide-binding protein DprA/Smf involved in DNA uptake
MDINETVFTALRDGQDWAAASKLATRTGIPIVEVRKALAQLALDGRVHWSVTHRDDCVQVLWSAARRRA